MPEITVKYDKEELERMLVELLLEPQGLQLASVEKPIKWHFKPLKVVIQAEVDPKVKTVVTDDTFGWPLSTNEPTEEIPETADFSPDAFPEGTNLAGLRSAVEAEIQANKRPLSPNESIKRRKK